MSKQKQLAHLYLVGGVGSTYVHTVHSRVLTYTWCDQNGVKVTVERDCPCSCWCQNRQDCPVRFWSPEVCLSGHHSISFTNAFNLSVRGKSSLWLCIVWRKHCICLSRHEFYGSFRSHGSKTTSAKYDTEKHGPNKTWKVLVSRSFRIVASLSLFWLLTGKTMTIKGDFFVHMYLRTAGHNLVRYTLHEISRIL